MSWKRYDGTELQDITDKLFGDGVDFKLQENITICLVVQRESYTITYEAETGGYVVDSNGFNVISYTEEVFFDREVKGSSVVKEACTKFIGWYNGETLITTNEVLTVSSVTKDITYTAKFKGEDIVIKLKVTTNTKRTDLLLTDEMLSNFLTLANESATYDLTNELDAKGYQVINFVINGYLAYDVLKFNLNIPDWFKILNVAGLVVTNDGFMVDRVYPTITDSGKIAVDYTINLAVKTFKVSVKANMENVISGVVVHDVGCVGLVSAVVINENGTIVDFVVEYGGTIDVSFTYVAGYMLSNVRYQYDTSDLSLGKEFNFDVNRATMTDIKADTVATCEFQNSKYKVNFYFNYYSGNFNDSNIYTYYIDHGARKFTDISGNLVTMPQTVIDPKSGTNESISFTGWNNAVTGLGKYTYLFDADGSIYRMVGDQKVYGFEYDLISYTDSGAIEVNLYGTWDYDKYRVDIEFAPNITYTQSTKDLFASTVGMFPYYDDNIPRECQYVAFSVGSDVSIIAPHIEGFAYYGWKIKDDASDISKGASSFEMPAKAITVVLYYAFTINVEVEEPIAGKNKAFANDALSLEIVEGEPIELKAYADKGYKFVGWKVDGIFDETLEQNATVTATKSCTYTAVFSFKGVEVVIENNDFVTLVANKDNLLLGETLVINIENLQEGYKLDTITINNVANLFTLSEDKTYYWHIITIDDVENGTITIRPVTATKTVKVTFVVNDEAYGKVEVNGVDATGQELNLNYKMQIAIKPNPNARMQLLKVLVNGTEIKNSQSVDLYNFALTLNTENHFDISDNAQNLVEFIYDRMFWIDATEEFNGDGTADNPYLIFNEAQLAYMASEINSGRWNQSPKKYYKLMENLDLTEKFWIPIGVKEYPFSGAFILNDHTITGVFLHKEYEEEALAWQTKLYGVFGYVTEDAELIFSVSRLPIILIISGSVLFILILAAILIIVFYKRHKKIQKLSKLLVNHKKKYYNDCVL